MDLNKLLLIGRLTAKPELRTTQTGRSVATFTIVTNRKYKSQEMEQSKATFHKIVCWGKTAEFISEIADKGSKVFCEGLLEQNDYMDKEGKKRKSFEVIASNIILLDRVQSNLENSNGEFKINTNHPAVNQAVQNKEIDDTFNLSDIPF